MLEWIVGGVVLGIVLLVAQDRYVTWQRATAWGRGEKTETRALYERVKQRYESANVPKTVEDMHRLADEFMEALNLSLYRIQNHHVVPDEGGQRVMRCIQALYEYEHFNVFPDSIPEDMTALQAAEFRTYLRNAEQRLGSLEKWKQTVKVILRPIADGLPKPAEQPGKPLGHTEVPALAFVNVPDFIETVQRAIIPESALFKGLRERLNFNICQVSGINPNAKHTTKPVLLPRQLQEKMTPAALLEAYLAGTPFDDLLNFTVCEPLVIPEVVRFSHQVTFAGTGWGKTQLLQRLIAQERHGFAVIDSQNDLINHLAHLKHDREVILIDPTDTAYPIAFSLFATDLSGRNESDTEAVLNSLIATYQYIFTGLLGAQLTARQGAMFGYVARLMLEIPNATILTLKAVFEHGEQFRPAIEQLHGIERDYFERQFFAKKLAPVKEQILDRLYAVLQNSTFRRLFSQTENKLDLYQAMQTGAIILINTAKSHLTGDLYQQFGKFFIALIAQATLKRQFIPESQRQPFFVFIDEAREYMDDPIYLEDLITQARKYQVGLNLFFQDTSQLGNLEKTLFGSTAIKFAGGVGRQDANKLAGEFWCDPEDLRTLRQVERRGSEWLCHIRNQGTSKVWIDYGAFNDWPTLSPDEYAQLRQNNRDRYCTPVAAIPTAPHTPTPPPTPAPAPVAPEPPLSTPDDSFLE